MLQTLLALAITAVPAPQTAAPDSLLSEWKTLSEHKARVRCLAFAPDGRLVSGGMDRLVCQWSAQGELVERIDLRPGGG